MVACVVWAALFTRPCSPAVVPRQTMDFARAPEVGEITAEKRQFPSTTEDIAFLLFLS